MNSEVGAGQAVCVDPEQATVCCRGASKALGHPAVYLSFDNNVSVQCYYCGCEFKRILAESNNP